MREWKSQSHVKWYCKYHIVFSPKYRKKAMFGSLRKGVGKILRELHDPTNVLTDFTGATPQFREHPLPARTRATAFGGATRRGLPFRRVIELTQ